ncbi:ABC transporter substrate-binding protein [Treponema phagedenis]|uniref:ABC transporter substrate-binding protein n=1 Tax=Treponema phagedenis TaxID=162 RepID=A0AAE6IS44_TREPH|nr:ABC transporter substrate-binding protein [Treponema phagedenis]EFW37376.1 hypothetical protein HMPREF9554_02135 [Treponema phagedenis F0421]NVP25134.1 ABC transporter substrate-binding protein [Treponema phagedenis]QEJ96090.1 ABC transporter substrate-binding protein [Treponema phagedenis]QEJ97248.1 ABC transporter substrate-binding protein [Treponema phagedenis]QEK01853.1 ABC transporter substrate-binding protein [Treponema phagedenis]
MRQKLTLCIVLLFAAFSVFAKGAKDADKTVKVVVPKDARVFCMANMISENRALCLPTEYVLLKSSELIQAHVIAEEADIALLPPHIAALLYTKGVQIQVAGSISMRQLYGITTENITGLHELKGKTIAAVDQGSIDDIILRSILKESGLEPDKDVFFNYIEPEEELASMFINGKISIAIVSEPELSVITCKKKNAALFLDVQEEWRNTVGENALYPQLSLVISKKLLKKHPKYIAAFVKALEESIAWAQNNPKKAGEKTAALTDFSSAALLTQAIPRMNLEWSPIKENLSAIKTYFRILAEANARLIGGKLPDEAFYFLSK